MTLREAKKLNIGDIILTSFGERHRIVDIDNADIIKSIIFTLDNGSHYAHTAIKEIETCDKVHEKYYQILAFNPKDKVDNVCHSHIYPTYVSCMSVKGHMARPCCFADICGHPLMLQSNPSDGLKFIDCYNARKMLELAKSTYPEKEFTIIEMNALCFGRAIHKWVVDL